MGEVAIKVEGLGKKYTIGKEKDGSLRGTMASIFKSSASKGEDFWALKDVSFDIMKGDVIGVIGKNGAGKSTLLKVLSQITKPTEGRIEINGRVASLLEVGTGFHPELTGRENIFLNGTILGMTRKEVASKFDEIVEFSGIKKFIDTPVKRYSSGQYVRLAFAVAAHLEPEILIIDEVLAVGDAEFQKKCLGKMKDVAGEGRTVIFVSHNLGAVRQLCNKSILIENGELIYQGATSDTIQVYQTRDNGNSTYQIQESNQEFFIKKADIRKNKIQFNENISFLFEIGQNIHLESDIRLLVLINNSNDQTITSFEKEISTEQELIIEKESLIKGDYYLNVIIYQPGVKKYDEVVHCCDFEIINNNKKYSHLEGFNIGNMYSKENWIDVK